MVRVASSSINEFGDLGTPLLGRSPSLRQLALRVPPVVYFFRTTDGLVKIGYTEHLDNRKRQFGRGWTHILALIVPGSYELEREMHERFAAHLARGREYFNPAPELIEFINDVRDRLGVGPVAA